MNSYLHTVIMLLLSFLTFGCGSRQELKAEKAAISDVQTSIKPAVVKRLPLSIIKSVIRWRATKLLGTAGHEGTLAVKEGTLFFSNDSLVGGRIVVDMNSISIINTAEYKQSTMRQLSNYLKKKEFNAGEFPVASFDITKVKYLGGDSMRVWGNMRIKGVTKNISVPAFTEYSPEGSRRFRTAFSLERTDWNIGSDGNLLEKNLVDEEFQLNINLEAGNN